MHHEDVNAATSASVEAKLSEREQLIHGYRKHFNLKRVQQVKTAEELLLKSSFEDKYKVWLTRGG